jgi:ribose transport system substrate-binding protein
MKKLMYCAIAAVMASTLLANVSDAAEKKYTIALIPGLTSDAFYITMLKGAQAAADALGVDLLFQGPPEWNVVQQVPVINAVIARRPDAILVVATDKTQLIAPLKKAVDSGIPVITLDCAIGDGHYQTGSGDADFPLSYIASDNFAGGEIAARALAKAIGDKGKVYVSNVKPGISTTDQRDQGFKKEMEKHPNITVLPTQFNDDDTNKAASQLQAILARNQGLAGVFGTNIYSAIGAGNGVKQANQTGKIRVVAFDATSVIIAQLKAGTIDIAIAQHPAEMGYYGVVTAYAHLTGHSVPPLIPTGYTVIDQSNVNDPNISKYIYSD